MQVAICMKQPRSVAAAAQPVVSSTILVHPDRLAAVQVGANRETYETLQILEITSIWLCLDDAYELCVWDQ